MLSSLTVPFEGTKLKEYDCLKNVNEICERDKLEGIKFISWAAYHASHLKDMQHPPSVVSLLPLFPENSKPQQ